MVCTCTHYAAKKNWSYAKLGRVWLVALGIPAACDVGTRLDRNHYESCAEKFKGKKKKDI